jgi:hypothetical protein
MRVAWRVSYQRLELLALREYLSSPLVCGVAPFALLFIFLCCPIMCLYVLSSIGYYSAVRIEGDTPIFTCTTYFSSHSAWYSIILIIIYIPVLVTTVTITPAGINNVVDVVG